MDSPHGFLATRTVQRHIKDFYLKSGITWGLLATFFRHTCATLQLDKGLPLEIVRANLGYEDISTTQIYLHLTSDRSRMNKGVVRFGF